VDRRTLTVLAIVVLGVVALGLSAATLTTPESSSGGGGQSGETGGEIVENQTDETSSDPPRIGDVESLVLLVAGLLVVASLVYMALYERGALVAFCVLLAAILALGLVIQDLEFQPSVSNDTGTGTPGEGSQNGSQEESGGGQETGSGSPFPTVLLAGVFLVLLLVAYAVLGRTVSQRSEESPEEDEPVQPETLGAIAGRAADRIETGDNNRAAADNEVYRAWQEMTSRLDAANEETTTPREFEQRAVEAGIAPEDVSELTRLFEGVRYGGEAVTDDRERRAVTVLRRIESKYSEQ
jgi:hypothetical protein